MFDIGQQGRGRDFGNGALALNFKGPPLKQQSYKVVAEISPYIRWDYL